MMRLALRPRWWAWHAALVVVLVAFGWLGWWQLQAFDRPSDVPAAPDRVVALDRVTEPGGRLGADDPGRRVHAEGTWEASGQLVVPGRELDGRVGSLVVTPLRTATGVLPVVRGWVPGDVAPPPSPGPVTVTGVVQPSEGERDARVGAGDVGQGEVAYVATVTLLEGLPYAAEDLYDGYVVLRAQQPADPGGPEPVEATASGGGDGPARWRNLAYGLQWWVFGGFAVFFWWSVLRRAAREQEQPRTGQPGAGRGPLAAPRRTT
jgi:cytochrome oxidase assembly protein ShyY1